MMGFIGHMLDQIRLFFFPFRKCKKGNNVYMICPYGNICISMEIKVIHDSINALSLFQSVLCFSMNLRLCESIICKWNTSQMEMVATISV